MSKLMLIVKSHDLTIGTAINYVTENKAGDK